MANFIRHKPSTVEHKKTPTHHVFTKLIIASVVLILLAYAVLQGVGFGITLFNNWNEIKFAYNKPEIVKSMRVKYQAQQAKLDQSFANPATKDKTQQLLEDISTTLKASSK